MLLAQGTQDKLFIRGHYYSDKPPVAALFLATEYRAWRAFTGESLLQPARSRAVRRRRSDPRVWRTCSRRGACSAWGAYSAWPGPGAWP